MQPWGLIVDKNLNIYTTVSQIDENQNIINNRLLCKINKAGQAVKLIQLNINFLQNDILFSNNSFYIIKENNIIKFSFCLKTNEGDEIEIVDKVDHYFHSFEMIDSPF